MTQLSVYKDLDISFGELDNAMSKLGFEKKVERTKDSFREEFLKRVMMEITYYHPAKNISFTLFSQTDGQPVPKHEVVKISYLLFIRGCIKHFDDFVKKVEKDRLKIAQAMA